MSVDILASVYEHINRGGQARFYGVSREARYRKADAIDLDAWGMRDRLSSAELFTSANSINNLYLFDGPSFNAPFAHLAKGKSGSSRIVNLPGLGFNDRAASLVQVATGRRPEFRVSFRDSFEEEWINTLDAQLGSDASRRGNPRMSWEAFPRSTSFLDPNLVYLKIHQDLNINIDWWPDYDAWVEYHIFLYLNGAGRVRGYCARWAHWIEGGLKTGGIADRLRPKVEAGATTLTQRLNARLDQISFSVADLYILPGRQRLPISNADETGDADEDATIVVELR